MASRPFDDLPSPLTQRERKVLAELEASLGEIQIGRATWLRSVWRALAIVVPLAGIAAGVSVAAAATLVPPAAVVLTGLVCAVAASIATALVLRSR